MYLFQIEMSHLQFQFQFLNSGKENQLQFLSSVPMAQFSILPHGVFVVELICIFCFAEEKKIGLVKLKNVSVLQSSKQ